MTDQQQIDRLEDRVNKLESSLWTDIKEIKERLTELAISAAANHCPAPGACIALEKRVDRLEGTHDGLAKTVADLIRWRAWLTGINLVISTLSLSILGIIGSYLIKKL